MKAIVAILFVCLAAGANGGCLGKLNPFSKHHQQQDYDLWGLEKWLDKKAPIGRVTNSELGYSRYLNDQFRRRLLFDNGTQRVVDLEILKNNLGKFEKQELEDTARLVVNVADLKECNQEVLVVLNEVARAKIVYGGNKRTEEILWEPLQALYKSCGEYVDKKLGPLSENSLNEKQKEFVTLVGDTDLHLVTKGFILDEYADSHSAQDKRPVIWNNFFRRLSQKDAKALVSERVVNEQMQTFKTIHHRDRFNHVIKQYLLPSCKSLTAAVGDKYDFATLEGLGWVLSKPGMQQVDLSWDRFMSHRPRAVQSLTSAYKFCSTLLSVKHNFDADFEVVKKFKHVC